LPVADAEGCGLGSARGVEPDEAALVVGYHGVEGFEQAVGERVSAPAEVSSPSPPVGAALDAHRAADLGCVINFEGQMPRRAQ
jgi:hypothetical protein